MSRAGGVVTSSAAPEPAGIDLVGSSAAHARLVQRIDACADTHVAVLLLGPTGTGKSLVARLIHERSRLKGAFVAANCAHLTAERAFVDLFGAVRGAYTGLVDARPGLIAEAERGTLFLDEVDSLPLEVQAGLLTFLDRGRWRRVGETTERSADVRVIAASNQSLDSLVSRHRFRSDLLFRLAQFPILMPALSERVEDIPALARCLLDRCAATARVETLALSGDALAWLQARPWPGNLRELESVIRMALLWARAEGANTIEARHFDTEGMPQAEPLSLADAERRFRRAFAQAALDDCHGNRAAAARRLGIHRGHLYEVLPVRSSGRR